MSNQNDKDHERGNGHPSSLESPHHLDDHGNVVYSPAQKRAIVLVESLNKTKTVSAVDDTRPPYLDHINPAHNDPERVEMLALTETTTETELTPPGLDDDTGPFEAGEANEEAP